MGERTRPVTAAALAAAVSVGAVVLVVVLGRSRPPDLPRLADQPEPRVGGAVAYLADGEDNGPCVATADLSDGTTRVLGCVDADLHDAAVADDGRGVVAEGSHPAGRLVLTFDDDGLVDRRVVGGGGPPEPREPGEPDEPPPVPGPLSRWGAERSDGTHAAAGHGDTRAEVTVISADGRVLAERRFDGGRGYAITRVGWTSDEQWLLLADNAGRLLVADERLRHARVVADDVRTP